MTSGGTKSDIGFIIYDDDPGYLKLAYETIGTKEGTPSRPNPTVAKWIEDVEGKRLDPTKTPWCAYWLGAMLQADGYQSTKSGMARSYLKYGEKTEEFIGAICVFWRGKKDDGITGHVGFLLDWDNDYVYVLGGNQGDSVSIQKFSRTRLLKIVKPKLLRSSRTMKAMATATLSEVTSQGLDWVPVVQKTVEEVSTPLEVVSTYVPWIKAVLAVLTVTCILAGAYYRYSDFHDKGR